MTKQERLAALKTTLDGFPGTIVPFESTFQVLLTSEPNDDIVGEFDELCGGYSTGTTKPIDGYAGSMTLYRYKREHAEELRDLFMGWVKAEIAKQEKRLSKPKKVIEAAAADGAAMDAAESLLDREQMRKEIMGQVTDFTSAIRHLFKALDAGYAKDEEIAALKRKIDHLNQEAIINTLQYKTEQQAKPCTRTAADAKVNDPVWFDCNGGIFDGYITAISADNRIHMMANDNSAFTHWTSSAFGIRWGYAEEEAK